MGPTTATARSGEAARSAALLERELRGFRGDITVADAAARGGLALRDAEGGLFHLASEYRGHLKATEKGELVFAFPRGLVRPAGAAPSLLRRGARALARAFAGGARFLLRAWMSIVFVGYAIVLGTVLVAWAVKNEGEGIGEALGFVLRIVLEAFYWTFHPFSPVLWEREPAWLRERRRQRQGKPKIPFYEKVNRFVFGPPRRPGRDEHAERAALASEARRLGGRMGPGDVMRVTGQSRPEAEASLCRLLLDWNGDVEVSDGGAVIYKFPALRVTAAGAPAGESEAVPIWRHRETRLPLTGNGTGTDVLLGAVNGFNLAASGWALASGLTIDHLLAVLASQVSGTPAPLPTGEVPLALGLVPFAFSAALFVVPAARAIRQGAAARAAAAENGRRALLRAVLERGGATMTAEELRAAWRAAAGSHPDDGMLAAAVRRIGGEPDVDEAGGDVYRFPDLAIEARALDAERQAAPAEEQRPGAVAFSSEE